MRRHQTITLDKNGQPKLTEKLFMQRVITALGITGHEIYHTWNSIHSPAGFPDIVAIHPKRKIMRVIEVKTETGKLGPRQSDWLTWFSLCGVEAELLRPSLFDDFWERIKQ